MLRGRRDRGLSRGDGGGRFRARRDRLCGSRRAGGPRGLSRLTGLDRAVLEAELDGLGFAGVVHVVGDDDEPPLTIVRGLADRAAGRLNTADTRFAVASISKLVTGLTVARLVDAGVVAYADRYVDLAGPAWTPPALDHAITLGQLLGHTSGFGDYFDEEDPAADYGAIWQGIPPGTMRGPRDFWPLLRDLPQKESPGAQGVYNDGAYILVGIALELRTGQPFPALVAEHVFGPLGIERSGFWALDDVVPDLAIGYEPPPADGSRGWRTNVHAVPVMGGPDGGVQVTAADLIRLIDAVSGRGEPGAGFLTAATRAELIGPHSASDDGVFRFGRGVLHVERGPSARFGHTGEDPGASGRVWTYPATGERVAVVSNVTEGATLITRRIDALLADVVAGRSLSERSGP